MKNNIYTVIVGDLVGSRDTEDRQKLAGTIPDILQKVSEEFLPSFLAPLTLTRGIDELSGVLKEPSASYKICREINTRVSPAIFRFAIVRGKLDVGIDTSDAAKMDGPAFHRAGSLIEQARKKERCYLFDLGLEDTSKEKLLNELTHITHLYQMRWTDREREVAALYEHLGSQESVAEKLGISQPAVSKVLTNIRWQDYQCAGNKITEALQLE